MKEAIIYVLFSGFSRLFTLFFSLCMALLFTPSEYVKIGYFTAFLGIMSSIIGFCSIAPLTNAYFEYPKAVVRDTVFKLFVNSLFCAIPLIALFFFLENGYEFFLATIAACGFYFFQIIQLEMKVQFKPYSVVVNESLRILILILIFTLLLFIYGNKVENYFFAVIGALFIPLIYPFFKYLSNKEHIEKNNCFQSILKASLILLPTVAFTSIISFSGRFILGWYSSPDEVGIYSFCSLFGQVIAVFSDALYTAYVPILYKNWSPKSKMPLIPYIMGIIAVFTFASIFLTSLNLLSPFLPLKFKPYLQDLYLISIIVFAFAFRSIYQFLNPFFIKTKKTHIITASSFVGCIICIIFTFYLVPIYSSRGAAFAVLLGLLSSSICSGIYFWSTHDKPHEYGIKNIEVMD